MKIRIASWNVNGLRAVHRKGNWSWFTSHKPDVLCLQETKSRPEQLPAKLTSTPGYNIFFDWPKEKKGYSGVGVYTNIAPDKIEKGIGTEAFDQEGRVLATYFGSTILFNVYFPNGGGGPARLEYKMNFYKKFLARIEALRKEGYSIIFCGDVNTAHNPIDLARPKENEKNTGFLPEERAWLDEVVGKGYVDAWRHLHPDQKDAYTYWDMKTAARERNVGWRIDYFFVSGDLIGAVSDCTIHSDVLGSDHCPIELTIDLDVDG